MMRVALSGLVARRGFATLRDHGTSRVGGGSRKTIATASVTLRIVRTGTWLYDDGVRLPVDVIGLDYDFWYELAKADGQLEPDEEPEPLPPEGFLYYVRFRRAGKTTEPTWVDSPGHLTVDTAMKAAEAKAPATISWSDPAGSSTKV